jgi:hypothetical protein
MTVESLARGPAPVVIGYWGIVAGLIYATVAGTAGVLVYPLDDTYIHMAMAKNMATHGVWGVTAEGFTSATSSPLWTGLLAAVYTVFGVSTWAPLVLNILIGTAVVFSVGSLVAGAGLPPWLSTLATAAVMFAGTLPTMTVLGMEHTLHILLTIWFVALAARLAGGDDAAGMWRVAALAAALTLTRYEGAFAVAAVAVALSIGGRWRAAAAIAAAGAVPLVLYGLWSQSHGGFLLPNSVLLKGVAPATTAVGLLQVAVMWNGLAGLLANPHLAVLVIAVLGTASLRRRDGASRDHVVMALVFVACTVLHLQFARAGWFYRYEAYLVVLGLVSVVASAARVDWAALWPANRLTLSAVVAVLVAGVLAFPLVRRSVTAVRQTPAAVSNIFEQQYQAGLFLDQFYRGRRVAVNDVGAIGYLADVKLLDVWGLASPDTALLKRRGEFTSAALAQLAERDAAEIAIIYPSWLGEYGGVPPNWQKVGEWRVTNNVVLGENGMSFYAVTAEARERLIENLAKYSGRLPADVVQEGLYLAHR